MLRVTWLCLYLGSCAPENSAITDAESQSNPFTCGATAATHISRPAGSAIIARKLADQVLQQLACQRRLLRTINILAKNCAVQFVTWSSGCKH
jgi:hypothetical protein